MQFTLRIIHVLTSGHQLCLFRQWMPNSLPVLFYNRTDLDLLTKSWRSVYISAIQKHLNLRHHRQAQVVHQI